MPLSALAIERIVLDLLADELSRSRGRSAVALGRSGWGAATRVDAQGLDLDSLERMDAASALNEFFHLHEYGAEDYLLALPSIGEWCELVAQSLGEGSGRLTFRTGGSTGEPRRCTHAIADLRAEADGWAQQLGAPAVVALVPAHHIYGAIFTALLPDVLGCPVVDAIGAARPGTVVVGTPTHWQYLARSLLAFPDGLTGVTSTAPMPSQLAHRLRGQRLHRLIEVYGSSETGGIGWRAHEGAAYRLLPRWAHADAVASPDHLRWLDERHFVIEGRRDGAVQVGGTNVFPARVRDALLSHGGVADAAVRLDGARLKAFVVPAPGQDANALANALDRWCGEVLSAPERPRRFATGAALPRNAMGKLADW